MRVKERLKIKMVLKIFYYLSANTMTNTSFHEKVSAYYDKNVEGSLQGISFRGEG
jgi:hypothetical protein